MNLTPTLEPEYDVIIVGAGPAGCACALSLADSGLRIALLEKGTFPRDKVCGDALSGKVLTWLGRLAPGKALPGTEVSSDAWGIRFFSPGGLKIDVPFRTWPPAPGKPAPGRVIRRIDFDHWLAERVKELPQVTFFEGKSVTELDMQPDQVRIFAGEWITGKMLVGADGANSFTARQLVHAEVDPLHHSAGVRAYYQGVQDMSDQGFIELHFLKELTPGYFWIFPLPDGGANVGMGMLTKDVNKGKINLRQMMEELVANHPTLAPRFKGARRLGPIQGLGLPLGSKPRLSSGNRFLLTGDAAALIDPFTGEGIGNALFSGVIASRHIRKAFETNRFDAQLLKAYDAEVALKMGTEFRLSHAMQRLVRFPWLMDWVVKRVAGNPQWQKLLTSMFDDLDLRDQLRKPSFYWRLLTNR